MDTSNKTGQVTTTTDSEKDMSENATPSQGLTKKDISKVTRRWIMSNTSAWSYERMQNVGFAWSLMPALKKLYGEGEKFNQALTRHMAFFNTEMTIGSPIIGATLAMEEQKAKGEDVPDDLIDAIKTGLMGPMAALGDSLYGATLNALLLSTCMGIAMDGNPVGPIVYLVAWIALTLVISFWGVRFGYKQGTNIMDSELFSEGTISKVTNALSVLGLVVIGGLAAGFVTASTPISWASGESVTELQTILDGLMPGLLPFIVVMVTWYLHDKKNVSVLKLLAGLIVVGAACSLLGIL